VSSSRRERQQHTAELLSRIQQQRLDFNAGCQDWLALMSPYDRGWKRVLNLRAWLVAGSGVMAIWSVRHPRFLMRWSKRGVGVWSTWRLLRNTLSRVRQ